MFFFKYIYLLILVFYCDNFESFGLFVDYLGIFYGLFFLFYGFLNWVFFFG